MSGARLSFNLVKPLYWEDLDRKSFFALLALTSGMTIVPFLPYWWERLRGTVTDEATWEIVGGNHGPWAFNTPLEILVYGCLFGLLLFLPMVSAIYGVVFSAALRRFHPLLRMVFLIALQLFCAFVLFWKSAWLID